MYQRKLYAFLHSPENLGIPSCLARQIFGDQQQMLQDWWNASTNPGSLALEIASSSDRVNLPKHTPDPKQPLEVRHPISGASQPGLPQPAPLLAHADIETAIDQIRSAVDNSRIPDAEKQQERDRRLFWWFWRFYPELLAKEQTPQTLLHPAHPILPDCPWHSYASTTSALVGAMISDSDSPETPYLLHFTFSPVQEFIKASRKFLDFWAGSYLLHYLSVKLCWYAAQKYGADAIITPSLWSQEIIDALMVQEFDQDGSTLFKTTLQKIQGSDPVKRFNDRDSTSLSTAGFPNAITILVPGKKAAETLGKELTHKLIEEWLTIAIGPPNEHQRRQGGICDHIRDQVIKTLNTLDQSQLLKELGIPEGDRAPYYKDLHQWKTQSNWQWRRLWEAQISHTWEPYWTAIPIASPGSPLSISLTEFGYDNWERNQNELAQDSLLSEQEKTIYRSLDHPSQFEQSINVGTWWGSIQQRLRVYTQSIKNNRTWQIPVAPGTRSTLSGQFSAVHPALNYTIVRRYGEERDLREGSGLPLGSMRLFWLVLSKAYPGLFNGSEQLNALELTKRMAWVYGGVAESLGIQVSKVIKRIETHRSPQSNSQSAQLERLLYERFIRFPNLSSVASARFIHDHPQKVQAYWQLLNQSSTPFNSKLFQRVTRIRPSHILKTDNKVNPAKSKRQYYNGAMFSAKWLAEDLNLDQPKTQELRRCVESAHKASGFGDGSPSDWWAIVLADGDGMGDYISGNKLETYQQYIVNSLVNTETNGFDTEQFKAFCNKTKKRMGPATHIGLNRALLDFSNRLVPYLAEQRFCGRVIYSGGDDVMAAVPLEDLPGFVRSLRAAWGAQDDPHEEYDRATRQWQNCSKFINTGDYWKPTKPIPGLPNRPLFTMGNKATMSMGIIIAHKTVPLPTVLESLWTAEKRAKEMPKKDGLCFRVIYSGGNQLEALMKGHLINDWWHLIKDAQEELSPLLYRLSEELPRRASLTEKSQLFSKAAQVIMENRDSQLNNFEPIRQWLDDWELWAWQAEQAEETKETEEIKEKKETIIGTQPKDLGNLLRFSAFWVDKMTQRRKWGDTAQVNL